MAITNADIFAAILPTADTILAQQASIANSNLMAGVRMLQKSRPADAIPFFKRAVALDSSNIDAYNYLGNTYLQLKKNDDAIATFKKLVAVKPFDKDSAVNLGNAYAQSQKYVDAEKMYKKAVSLSPNDTLANYSLGQTYLAENKLKEAETSFLKVTRLSPRDANGFYGLGATYNKMGKFDAAVSALKQSISLKHDFYAVGENELGYAYAGQGNDDMVQTQITRLKANGQATMATNLNNATFKPKITGYAYGIGTPFFPQLSPNTPISMFTLTEPVTTIAAINDAHSITLSGYPTSAGTGNFVFDPTIRQTGNTNPTTNPNQITGLTSTVNLFVGMTVSGKGIADSSIITSINTDGTSVTLSKNTTDSLANSTIVFGPTNHQVGNSDPTLTPNQITGLSSTAGLSVGMKVTGTGIPDGTTITAINNGTDITLSSNTTQTGNINYIFTPVSTNLNGSINLNKQISGLASTAGLSVGMAVSGTGIPPTMTLSKPNATKDLTAVFSFNTNMDPVSIMTLSNWSITKATGGKAGYYNNGYTLYPQKEASPPILKYVTYDPTNQQATLTFSLTQNANGDAVIDPSHMVFRFTGKDSSGTKMDPKADQYDGFARQAF
ncbi:MAG: tetratricopeptide repeat protein [Desulfuromonadales bacterium]